MQNNHMDKPRRERAKGEVIDVAQRSLRKLWWGRLAGVPPQSTGEKGVLHEGTARSGRKFFGQASF